MPNVSVNLSGAGTIVGDATFTGRVTSAGFTSTIAGTTAAPAYAWSTGVHASGPATGLYHEGARLGVGYNNADKAYWGATNHNYVAVSCASQMTAQAFGATTNGDVNNPVFYWTTDTDLGFFRNGANNMRAVSAGAYIQDILSSGTNFAGNNGFVSGNVTVSGGSLTMGSGRKLILDNNTTLTDLPLQFNGDPNTGIVWDSADDMRFVSNGTAKGGVSTALVAIGNLSLANHLIMGTGSYIEMSEWSGAAPAGAADKVRIYGIVDGGSKTDLAAIFQSGAAQVFAQEP